MLRLNLPDTSVPDLTVKGGDPVVATGPGVAIFGRLAGIVASDVPAFDQLLISRVLAPVSCAA